MTGHANRYLLVARKLVDKVYPDDHGPGYVVGLGLIVVPGREQEIVADALAEVWAGSRRVRLGTKDAWPVGREHRAYRPGYPAENGPLLTAVPVVATLPADDDRRREILTLINGARGRIATAAQCIALVVNMDEARAVQQYAGDSYSTAPFVERCPFVADDHIDDVAARRELAAWYRQRFGQLDLRGFIRVHTEDVVWAVEDVYQELHGEAWSEQGVEALSPDRRREDVLDNGSVDELDEAMVAAMTAERPRGPLLSLLESTFAEGRCAVILGHPGSGKTFFLRWLALHATVADEFLGMTAPLPVLLPMAAYATVPRLPSLGDHMMETWLHVGQPAAHILDRAMAEGRVLFLLDGLDEISDRHGRERAVRAIRDLADVAPDCRIVATSRITGYSAFPVAGEHIMIAPLEDVAITAFLRAWCELHARGLHGPGAAEKGRAQGESLARMVLENPQIRALAQNPLLLTILAIVQRAGVRLPDHRVELYSHVTQVLVERWNQVRSLAQTGGSLVPIRVADAVRLLGPVALSMIESGSRAAISRESLVRSIDASLKAGNLRAITTAEDALTLFQRSLGLIIEQGPGVYGFQHLTLVEYLAARELVRTGGIEELCGDAERMSGSWWLEVILLAAGELGLIRADDLRLGALVRVLIEGYDHGQPFSTDSVLSRMLADDPDLSSSSTNAIVGFLVEHGRTGAMLAEDGSILRRIRQGRHGELFEAAIEDAPDRRRRHLRALLALASKLDGISG